MDIQLSVIIVNYNGKRFFKECFNALAVHLQDINHEIIVVDNLSADDSCAYLRTHYPNIVLIEPGENLGFGRGNNLGVSHARGKYILLLNNDTILQSPVAPLLKVLQQQPDAGVIGINMLNAKGTYLKAAGNFPSALNLFRIKNIFWLGPEFKKGIFSKQQYSVDWVTGSFMLMTKELYTLVGGFDADYFMYVEDVDLCKRIANAGYKRLFLPTYSYIHFVGYNSAKDPLVIAGYDLYIKKHAHGLHRFLMQTSLGINKLVKKIKKLAA